MTDTGDGGSGEVDLQGELDSAKLQLRLKETERAKLAARNKELEDQGSKQKEELKKMEVSGKKLREQYDGLRSQKMLLQGERARAEELEQELRQVRNKLETFKGVEVALRAQEGDLNQFLHERGAFDMRTKDLANLVIMMKQKLAAVKVERSKLEAQLKTVESQHASEKSKVQVLETKMVDIKAIARNCQTELEEVRAENIDLKGRVKRNQTHCQCAVGAQSPLAAELEEAGVNWEVEKREDISEKGEDEIRVKLPTFTSAGASQLVKNDDDSFLRLSTRGILSQVPRHVSEVEKTTINEITIHVTDLFPTAAITGGKSLSALQRVGRKREGDVPNFPGNEIFLISANFKGELSQDMLLSGTNYISVAAFVQVPLSGKDPILFSTSVEKEKNDSFNSCK